MLCVRCKKRPAIVFVQKLEAGEAKSEGYCLSCARELGIRIWRPWKNASPA